MELARSVKFTRRDMVEKRVSVSRTSCAEAVRLWRLSGCFGGYRDSVQMNGVHSLSARVNSGEPHLASAPKIMPARCD